MNHITQEPKSLYLAVELEYRREYKAAHELRTLQARIDKLEAQLYAIGAGGVGRMMPEPQQDDAQLHCDVCGVECANPWHFSTETKRHKHACDACWDGIKIQGQVVELDHTPAAHQEPVAWRVHPFDYGVGYKGVYALTEMPEQVEMWKRKGWGVEPLYTAPQPPVQQEPVAWMYEWNGSTHITTADQRPIEHAHPHFNKSKPLYTAPQPTENLNCKSNQKRLATLWGYVKQEPAHKPLTDEQIIEIAAKTQTAEPGTDGYILPISFARAIEAFHNITGDQ